MLNVFCSYMSGFTISTPSQLGEKSSFKMFLFLITHPTTVALRDILRHFQSEGQTRLGCKAARRDCVSSKYAV